MVTTRASELSKTLHRVYVQDMSHDGRGVARIGKKVVFIAGALPEEWVDVRITHEKSQYAQAQLQHIVSSSPQRIKPQCSHFLQCGGCQLQHISHTQQIDFKQQQLQRLLDKTAIDQSQLTWFSALTGSAWHYRHRVRFVINKQGQLCLRAQGGSQQIAITECPQIVLSLQQWMQPLTSALTHLPIQGLEEIECLAIGGVQFVLHVNRQWKTQATHAWKVWGQQHQITGLYIQSTQRGASLQAMINQPLSYSVDGYQLQLTANQFVQAHAEVNQQMVKLACEWLAAGSNDEVCELFCGIGNFTLNLASAAAWVYAYELNESSVETARNNAQRNGIERVTFTCADLFSTNWCLPNSASHVLLDPPREGAAQACQFIGQQKQVKRILYVSCHPATMVRDMAYLQNSGFRLHRLALADQFPQTYHSEAIALLIRA